MMRSLEEGCAFHAYKKTLDLSSNIALNMDYQKNYTNYYRVRRDAQWLKAYYQYLEEHKHDKDITFEQILRHLSEIPHAVKISQTNRDGIARTVEASFASKMLATINPDHPVWDSQVLRFLEIRTPQMRSHSEKIEACIEIYAEIEREISDFIRTQEGRACIEVFDLVFPRCRDFSDFKKIDFYLWNLGK